MNEMNLKKFGITIGLIGLASIVPNCIWFYIVVPGMFSDAPAIGIIGGADGPTAMYLTRKLVFSKLGEVCSLGIACILTSVVCLLFRKTVEKCCTVNTTVLSLLISASAALLLLFGRAVWGIIFGVLMLGLIALYVIMRRKHTFVVGVVIDVLTCLVYMPFFISAFANILI